MVAVLAERLQQQVADTLRALSAGVPGVAPWALAGIQGLELNRPDLWHFNQKWFKLKVGPSVRVVLLPGKPPMPVMRLKQSMIQARLQELLKRDPGTAYGFVGLEAAQAAYCAEQGA
ncbi:hypothetical protein WJX81_007457 [Elliptochloris bilobata]|uniref:Uncharacterized protein n=1 Tax=Elliptochloris bilobata TaxID=381761 RepID=A0AAW1QZH6_9CHLO